MENNTPVTLTAMSKTRSPNTAVVNVTPNERTPDKGSTSASSSSSSASTKETCPRCKRCCTQRCIRKTLLSYVPIIKYIRTYRIREYALGDFLSGLTVSFMALPQAMGFGILASLHPINGLYTSLFPMLAYMIFGSSPYISFGTNAVMALLTQSAVEREVDIYIAAHSRNTTSYEFPTEAALLEFKIGISEACCFWVGLFLGGMGLLKFGFVALYLSDSFIGGFTTAAAIHIASSQVPKVFGIPVKTFSGAGKLVRMYIDLFSKISQTKTAELIIAIICMIVLLLVKICVNERFSKKMKMPVPIDLIVVVVGTLISHFAQFQANLGVNIVGPIPSGFEHPTMPNFADTNIIMDSLVMAILSFAMGISMAKITARKHNLQVNNSQEFSAYGVGNFVSAFFNCFPSATAPPRTMILSSLGAKTTLNAIPTSIFILLVILLIGPLFVSLPLSVLAAMIIVSIKDLLLQYRNLPTIWKVNKYDFIIWVVTNVVCVFADLDYGIIVGFGISIFLVVVQSQMSSGSLVQIPKSRQTPDDNHDADTPLEGVKIFTFPGALYFATTESFRNEIYKNVLNPKKYKKWLQRLSSANAVNDSTMATVYGLTNTECVNSGTPVKRERDDVPKAFDKPKLVIIDCSVMSYLDIGGVNMLKQIIKEYEDLDISVRLVNLLERPRRVLYHSDFFANFARTVEFKTLGDALNANDSEILKT